MDSLRLAFLTKSDPDSGNYNTAQRICEQLIACRRSWKYTIIPVLGSNGRTYEGKVPDELFGADVLLCLHLFRCAALVDAARRLRPILPPLIGIAGGTDLNMDSRCPDRCQTMRQFVRQCRHVVVFSESMLRELTELIGESCSHVSVTVIPQGIRCPVLDADRGSLASVEKLVECSRYFIILGRIRPVKNCSSVLEPFRRWGQLRGDNRVRLLFVGDIEDSEYGEDFKAKISRLPDAELMSGVNHSHAMQLMQHSLGLINCSLSEGQSNSILEAMSLRVAVIVSAIPGNLDIVRHMQTGFVFHDEEQLLQWLDLASAQDAGSRQLVSRITDAARTYVHESHSVDSEQRAYAYLIANCCERDS